MPVGLIATHIGDLLYCHCEGKSRTENILKKSSSERLKVAVSCCGRRFVLRADFSARKTVKPIETDKKPQVDGQGDRERVDKARSGRHDWRYRVYGTQRVCSSKATVQDAKNANQIMEFALQGSDLEIN